MKCKFQICMACSPPRNNLAWFSRLSRKRTKEWGNIYPALTGTTKAQVMLHPFYRGFPHTGRGRRKIMHQMWAGTAEGSDRMEKTHRVCMEEKTRHHLLTFFLLSPNIREIDRCRGSKTAWWENGNLVERRGAAWPIWLRSARVMLGKVKNLRWYKSMK